MTPSAPPANDAMSRDAQVIGLIGFAHGVSHFFHLLLAPLFPWLMKEFALDFTSIGATVSVFFVVSGIGQAAAGFFVDRFGPVRVLIAGISCFLLAGLVLALARESWHLFPVAALAGLGNSVFHPADFTVLNRRVSSARLGHAFSIHGLSGNLGWAAAPVFLVGIASYVGWRYAAAGAGLLALPAMALLWRYRAELDAPPAPSGKEPAHGTFAFLKVRVIWLCFAFFFLMTVAFGAIQNFVTPVLQQLYDLALPTAVAALTTYLLASAAGILVGGFIAQKQAQAQDKVIALALTTAAVLAVVLALGLVPAWCVLPLMAGIGFFSGTAGPSRDLLVRRAATARFGQGSYGRIYGFVYSGLDSGLALSPLLFGRFMDHRQYALVLVGIAVAQSGAILTALRVGRAAEKA